MLVCAVKIRGFTQICLTVSGLCVVMRFVVCGGLIVVCRCGSVCNQIKVHTRGCRKVIKTGWQVVRPWMGSLSQLALLARGWGGRVRHICVTPRIVAAHTNTRL